MSKRYVMGIDFGTTGVKAHIYDINGRKHGEAYFEAPTVYPKPAYAEIDPDKIVQCVQNACKASIENAGIDPKDIIGVSSSNICGSMAPIDKEGNFVYPIIPWNDNRCFEVHPELEELMNKAGTNDLEDYKETGYNLQAMCTLGSMYWFKKNHPDLYEKTYKFLSCQAIVNYALTGTTDFVDEKGYLSYTKLARLDTMEYDKDLCDRYGLDIDKLAEAKYSTEFAGTVSEKASKLTGLAPGTPVYVGAGDATCAGIGSGVLDDKAGCVIIGTGSSVGGYSTSLVTHEKGYMPIFSAPAKGDYYFFGTSAAAASCLKWFVDEFCKEEKIVAKEQGVSVYEFMNHHAEKSPVGANGVMFTTWMQGAAVPFFSDTARGTFTGLSLSATKCDVVRAIMEGVALELKCILEVAEETKGKKFEVLRLQGGAARSKIWTQIVADVCGIPVETTVSDEAAALASACYAAVGAGVYEDIPSAIKNMVKVKERVEPNAENHKLYQEMYKIYNNIYKSLSPEVFPAIAKLQK